MYEPFIEVRGLAIVGWPLLGEPIIEVVGLALVGFAVVGHSSEDCSSLDVPLLE